MLKPFLGRMQKVLCCLFTFFINISEWQHLITSFSTLLWLLPWVPAEPCTVLPGPHICTRPPDLLPQLTLGPTLISTWVSCTYSLICPVFSLFFSLPHCVLWISCFVVFLIKITSVSKILIFCAELTLWQFFLVNFLYWTIWNTLNFLMLKS